MKIKKAWRVPLIFVSVLILLAVVVLGARFVLGGDEDIWVCVNGEWGKHGNPSAPKPQTGCCGELETKTYVNKELGFSLQIPKPLWEGKYEVKLLSLDPKIGSKKGSIMSASFDFVAKNPQMLFSINRVSKTTWEELQKEELFRGRKLGESEEVVYYAEISLDNPYVGKGDTYQRMAADINFILATFKMVKP
jgi:hypothetical protein